MSKQQMIETLLSAYDWSTQAYNDDTILLWIRRVSSALEGAGMEEELKVWEEALEGAHFYKLESGIDPTLIHNVESMRAILLGFLDKVKRAEPAEDLFPVEIVKGTRKYIESLALQANGCYQYGWYDACAVIVRRLVEIMIIDCFERYDMPSKIDDDKGRRFGLEKLIDVFLSETAWHTPYMAKKYMPELRKLKDLGDAAAHGRDITLRPRIDRFAQAISYTFQALVEIAYR